MVFTGWGAVFRCVVCGSLGANVMKDLTIHLVVAVVITVIFYSVAFAIVASFALFQQDAQGIRDVLLNRTGLEVVYVFIGAFIASSWVLAPEDFDDD